MKICMIYMYTCTYILSIYDMYIYTHLFLCDMYIHVFVEITFANIV